jgi:hypothetical protein
MSFWTERRREAAQRGTQTRRQRREQRQSETQSQPAYDRRTQAPTTRRLWPRVHADLLTVTIRGPFAERMRRCRLVQFLWQVKEVSY